MRNASSPDPIAHITLELCSDLEDLLSLPAGRELHRRTLNAVRALMKQFQLPPLVSLSLVTGQSTRALRIIANGLTLPLHPTRFRETWLALAAREIVTEVPAAYEAGFERVTFLEDWFVTEAKRRLTTSEDLEPILDCIERLAIASISDRPDALVSTETARAYAASPPAQQDEAGTTPISDIGDEPYISVLCDLLRFLLKMGVAVGRNERVLASVDECVRTGRPIDEIGEELYSEWRSNLIEVRVPESDLVVLEENKEIVRTTGDDRIFSQALVDALTEFAYGRFGVRLPDVVLVSDSTLDTGTVTLRINDYFSSLRSSILVDGEIAARRPIDVLREVIEGEIARFPGRFVSTETVEYELAYWANLGWLPALVRLCLEHVPLGRTTRILRQLIQEGVPAQYLRLVLELLFKRVATSPGQGGFEVRPPSARRPKRSTWDNDLIHVRRGLRSQLTARARGAQASINAYRLPTHLEKELKRVLREGWTNECDVIANGLRSALRVLGADAYSWDGLAVVTKSCEIRLLVREILEVEFPNVPVLCDGELTNRVRYNELACFVPIVPP